MDAHQSLPSIELYRTYHPENSWANEKNFRIDMEVNSNLWIISFDETMLNVINRWEINCTISFDKKSIYTESKFF